MVCLTLLHIFCVVHIRCLQWPVSEFDIRPSMMAILEPHKNHECRCYFIGTGLLHWHKAVLQMAQLYLSAVLCYGIFQPLHVKSNLNIEQTHYHCVEFETYFEFWHSDCGLWTHTGPFFAELIAHLSENMTILHWWSTLLSPNARWHNLCSSLNSFFTVTCLSLRQASLKSQITT